MTVASSAAVLIASTIVSEPKVNSPPKGLAWLFPLVIIPLA